jgi:hypothetical protein
MAFIPERNYLEETLVTGYNLNLGPNEWDSSDVSMYNNFSVQIIYTAAGGSNVLSLQQSNDGANWDDIENSTVDIPVGSGSTTLDRSVFTGKYLRVNLTAGTSGSLTLKTLHKR